MILLGGVPGALAILIMMAIVGDFGPVRFG
jgi:hypothetical protein